MKLLDVLETHIRYRFSCLSSAQQVLKHHWRWPIIGLTAVIMSSCGGGKSSGSPDAVGNTILPSAPTLDPPALTNPGSSSLTTNTTTLNIAGTCKAGATVWVGGDDN